MKTFFLVTVFTALNQLPVYAAKKSVLLTSIDLSSIIERLSREDEAGLLEELEGHFSYLQMLEARFRSTFEALQYDVEIYHQVDQNQLYEILNSNNYEVVYWVSHGGAPSSVSGLFDSGGISDIYGFDITPIFQRVSNSIRILAVISCFSEISLRTLLEIHSRNPNLKIITFGYPIDIKKALLHSLRTGSSFLSGMKQFSSSDSDQDIKVGFPVTIIRHCHSNTNHPFISLRVESSLGEVLTTIPSCTEGQIVQKTFYLNAALGKIDLQITSGERMAPDTLPFNFGELTVESFLGKKWTLFRNKATGKPYGKYGRLWISKEELQVLE